MSSKRSSAVAPKSSSKKKNSMKSSSSSAVEHDALLGHDGPMSDSYSTPTHEDCFRIDSSQMAQGSTKAVGEQHISYMLRQFELWQVNFNKSGAYESLEYDANHPVYEKEVPQKWSVANFLLHSIAMLHPALVLTRPGLLYSVLFSGSV